LASWTDDQFLVVLSGCEHETLPSLCEHVRRTLAGEGIEWWGERDPLPVSIGHACVRRISVIVQYMVKNTDDDEKTPSASQEKGTETKQSPNVEKAAGKA